MEEGGEGKGEGEEEEGAKHVAYHLLNPLPVSQGVDVNAVFCKETPKPR